MGRGNHLSQEKGSGHGGPFKGGETRNSLEEKGGFWVNAGLQNSH